MRNILNVFFGLVLLGATVGCGIIDRIQGESAGNNQPSLASNKSLEDKAIDAAVGDTKIGIAECDEVVEILNEQINNPEDNFIVKAAKRAALNQFRDQLNQRLEQNQTDKKAVAEFCAEFKRNVVQSNGSGNTNTK